MSASKNLPFMRKNGGEEDSKIDVKMMMPVMFTTHGGGPMPVLGDDKHQSLITWMKGVSSDLAVKPSAILVISAHWEEQEATVNISQHPGLLYDYGGFPENAYKLQYPAPGSPHVAEQVVELLTNAGIPCKEKSTRGWDHGVFVPLLLMFPDADIPVVELSLVRGLDPELHVKMGKALQDLRQHGVLILGSGASYHNIQAMFRKDKQSVQSAKQFDDFLCRACCKCTGDEREQLLVRWETAVGAREAHPREEHLIPLLVAAGAAGQDTGHQVYSNDLFGVAHSCFQFGANV